MEACPVHTQNYSRHPPENVNPNQKMIYLEGECINMYFEIIQFACNPHFGFVYTATTSFHFNSYPFLLSEIRVPSSRGAGILSSSTLERLKGFVCPSEPQGRGPPGPRNAGGGPGDVGGRPGDVGGGCAHGGNGPGDVGGREAVAHGEMTGDQERQKSEEEWRSPEPSTKKQVSDHHHLSL